MLFSLSEAGSQFVSRYQNTPDCGLPPLVWGYGEFSLSEAVYKEIITKKGWCEPTILEQK